MAFSAGNAGRPDYKEGAEAAVDVLGAGQSLQLVFKRMRFSNAETGAFIGEGKPIHGSLSIPEAWQGEAKKLQAGGNVVIKGVSPSLIAFDPLDVTLECNGNWVLDPVYGLQFDVLYVREVIPTTPDALRRYLSSGRLKGIGPGIAKEMVSRWGAGVLRILDHTPEKLLEITGLTPGKVDIIKEQWRLKREFYELVSFLGIHGIGEGKALKIQDQLGSKDLEARIRENPYRLTEVEGIGFQTADKLALSLGRSLNDPLRIQAALLHILNESVQKDGHTAIAVETWLTEASGQLGMPKDSLVPHCQELLNTKTASGQVRAILRDIETLQAEQRFHGTEWVRMPTKCVSPFHLARQENEFAKNLKRLVETAKPLDPEDEAQIRRMLEDPNRRLDPSQKHAVWIALTSPMAIITGGPGTGKTTTLRTAVDILHALGQKPILSAPTGRAAKRMEEAIDEEAMTMHRRLKFIPGKGFEFGPNQPMEGEVFIVDESSMVDTTMAWAWARAIPDGGRVIWVGDADQLPSVGAGDVLRDLIESQRIPVARLTKVHRQAEGSGIAWNAKTVLEGRPPALDGNPWTDDFAFVRSDDNPTTQRHLVELVRGLLNQGVKHQDIQVLSPQRTGDVGTGSLNELLRWHLNPTNPVPPEADPTQPPQPFQVGERVMQTRNNYDLEVFNGDMGTIKDVRDDDSLKVEMEDGRTVEYSRKAAKDLTFGYAITVHKSQGGERPVVLLVCSHSHSFILNRNLIYTGITRGRQKVVMVGSPKTALLAAKKKDELVRITGLRVELDRVFGPKAAPRPPKP